MTAATRPAGVVSPWASDAAWSSPGDPWDMLPTKTAPTIGIIQQGWFPNEQPPPDRMNWRINDQDRRIAVHDMIEARSFVEPGDGGGICNPGTGGVVGDFAGSPWTIVPTIWRVAGSTVLSASTNGGYTWTAELTLASCSLYEIATRDDGSNQGAVAIVFTNAAVAQITMRGPVGAFVSTALTTTGNAPMCIRPEPYVGNGFWVGGGDTSTTQVPTVWRVVDNHGIYTSKTQLTMSPTGAIGAGAQVRLLAVSPTYKLAAMYVGGVNYLWRWLDGDTMALGFTTPTTDEIRDILWLPEDKMFLLIASSAGHVVSMWKSGDGSTGSWVAVVPDSTGAAFLTADAYVHGACVCGGIVMVPINYNSGAANIVMVSGNLGVTWRQVADPLQRHQSQTPVPVTQVCRNLGERFIAAGYVAASKSAHALSLRAG